MLIQITNLPGGITHKDISDLLEDMSIIDRITLVDSGNPDNVLAWVEMNCSQVGCNAVCDLLSRHFFKGRHLLAYTSLYSH